jgi:hypothetical protein
MKNEYKPKKARNGVRQLQTFRGYTVDERLREFRKVTFGSNFAAIEFVPFDSEMGIELLRALKGV